MPLTSLALPIASEPRGQGEAHVGVGSGNAFFGERARSTIIGGVYVRRTHLKPLTNQSPEILTVRGYGFRA
jgi:hypothetical protein